MRRLIFNADDYGLSPGVSEGILQATNGIVRSTTVMANLASDVELAALRGNGIGIGVHLNVSTGVPLTGDYPQGLLDGQGRFLRDRTLLPETWDDAGYRRAALGEWEAQVWRLEAAGVHLDHFDSHHHVHLFPQLFPAALGLARRFRLGLRTDRRGLAAARSAGVPAPDRLVTGFCGKRNLTRQRLLSLVASTRGDIVEVMCHPGRVDSLLAERSSYVAERQTELDLLSDPELALSLEDAGWVLASYAQAFG